MPEVRPDPPEEVSMPTIITWLGHAAIMLQTGGKTVLIDPFLSDNPAAAKRPRDVSADYILISHGHGDHVGDALAIARRTHAEVIANFEICNWIEQQGYAKVHAQHIGGGHAFPFGRVKLTIAHHGSAMPDGSYGGNPAGFLLYLPDGKLYCAQDTGLFYDMKLIGEEGIDVALLPIGDNYTMGPDDALRAVKLIEPRVVIPIHYNTFELIAQDAPAWARRVESETKTKAVVLKPGESFQL
jgi:L-ascorbate metabolism protein UlaG (beta-lactamase superfamily)